MQVSEHVHALKIPFTITTGAGTVERFVYAFLVYGSKICLIDTGVASSQQLIFDYIRQTGREPEEIAAIILTHSHPDHIGSAKSIQQLTGCKILAHQGEIEWIQNIDKQFSERPVPGFYSLVEGSVTVDQVLEEGDKIDLDDNLNLKVLHTPGHSNGSISLYLEADKVLISGDVIPIPGDMPIYDDPMILIESIKKLKGFKEAGVLLSSWDEPRTDNSIEKVMTDGIGYVECMHRTVLEAARVHPDIPVAELCKVILEGLNEPMFMANPLVVRSLTASLKYLKETN